MGGKRPGVTLYIPTLNEYEAMKVIMPQIRKAWYDQLLIVDGGSTDGTLEYCKEHGYPVVMQSQPGKGLPNATLDAFRLFDQDIFIAFSPDGNSIAELIPPLVDKMMEGYDMVIVSRYLDGAKSEDDDFLTAIGNKTYTWLMNTLFGSKLTDSLVIYRAFTREAMLKMELNVQTDENWVRKHWGLSTTWEIASSIRSAKLGLKVGEIPGDEPIRIGGVRKMSIIFNGIAGLFQIFYEYFMGMRVFKRRPPEGLSVSR
ncbi:MAG: hypothetical protein A2902_00140 [Elusimicrobia bacterium RIFCSPLOWO2_01_FULL_64_13]|nr:MAG: hypothetical protein A2902_00140 [Elusimicrobia bacterium RIFCSPLOWO2_01_FULL_64_13]